MNPQISNPHKYIVSLVTSKGVVMRTTDNPEKLIKEIASVSHIISITSVTDMNRNNAYAQRPIFNMI